MNKKQKSNTSNTKDNEKSKEVIQNSKKESQKEIIEEESLNDADKIYDKPNQDADIQDNNIENKIEEKIDYVKFRNDIWNQYDINIDKEKKKQEKKIDVVQKLLEDSGFKIAYQLIISEIVSKKIESANMYTYMCDRLKELGKEYIEYVI